MIDHGEVSLALRNRLLTVADLPASRAWDNIGFRPVTGTPYVEESYVPASGTTKSLSRDGRLEMLGLYLVRYYGIAKTSSTPIWAAVTAILNAFSPTVAFTLTSGDDLRIRGDLTPYAGQILQMDTGHACVTITVPWRLLTAKA